jgi:hypothetical protein
MRDRSSCCHDERMRETEAVVRAQAMRDAGRRITVGALAVAVSMSFGIWALVRIA